MLLLFETAAGFAVFKVLNEKKLKHAENLYLDFESPESAGQIVKLKQFQKFGDITTALASATATVEGKMSKPLKKLMKKLVSSDAQEELAVADAKLGNIIKEKFDIQCVANSSINELMRCIRSQLDSLIGDKEIEAFSRGLAHSLSRYKLKFSPEKVDTMIVQAISALDDADKELNNYCMRAKEWYSWHFPELGKVVTDHESFVRTVMKIGNKLNAAACDLSDILPEGVEGDVKEAAEISMGTEIAEEDILMILNLCQQIVEMTEHRSQLYEYLKNRMVAIAPNLTTLVGELVGARLVSHAGSLVNLAKHPSSTVQILGAEKALFRALKAKHDTPKYGLIYHASLVGQTTPKNKGKLSRMLAAKSSLAARVDAFGEETNVQMGLDNRAKLEMRIRQLENKGVQQISGTGKRKANDDVYENKSEVRVYNTAADSTLPSVSKKRKLDDTTEAVSEGDASFANDSQSEKKKKKKKIKQEDVKTEPGEDGDTSFADVSGMSDGGEKKKKKKKKIKVESDD